MESLDPSTSFGRPRADGKFLFLGEEKLYVRGVTYGTFRPGADGSLFPPREIVAWDFAQMRRNGVNAIRIYCVPPRWLLDEAGGHGLLVMVGIPWEQHVAFLDDPDRVAAIERRVRTGVSACCGHPAVLCYAVGNEIPASIVRWAGSRRVERHLHRLYQIAKDEDPEGLVTYGNFPSTEYLDLQFMDLACFNVYLEQTRPFGDYLARLQNLANDRPLLLGELGLDSRRNGRSEQARAVSEQLSSAFAGGCAGAFVFAWTDEWHRGGQDVRDWDFGLTDRERRPKPALPAVKRTFDEAPFPPSRRHPPVSVVVCVYNGEETLGDCLRGLANLDYGDYEVIVVDDGSTDRTAEIAAAHPFRLIRTENCGLSAARNTGLGAASGEVVAYIDADARPDPHWLSYLVATLRDGDWAGVGGPNLPDSGDGLVADCVARAPGGPIHVLLSDREAEHIPGCNMAFRRSALEAVGGFDVRFRTAGDDVDLCWRLQERGWKLGFSPSAVVWHHQRRSMRAYWRQQRGYGHAEALLEHKWPEKYNAAGQVAWSGRIYAPPLLYALTAPSRVYHGTWGTAPFQHRQAQPGLITSLAASPEWYLVIAALALLSLFGVVWAPLLLATPLLLLAAGASLWRAFRGATSARFGRPTATPWDALRRRVVTALLFLAQPAARLQGRLSNGLTPWRFRRVARFLAPWPRQVRLWSEQWRDVADWLHGLEGRLKRCRAVVCRGGPYDRWDLEVRDGAWGVVRLRMCIEEHGSGRQLVRFRIWPQPRLSDLVWLGLCPGLLAAGAALDDAWLASTALGLVSAWFLLRVIHQSAAAMALTVESLPTDPSQGLVMLPPEKPDRPPRRDGVPAVEGVG